MANVLQNLRRNRLNYLQELGQARAHRILTDKRRDVCEVATDTNCWLFTGSTNNDGYGQVWTKKNSDLQKTGRNAQTAFLIHRVAYLAATGQDAAGQVSHLCDRPKCFNPDHLVDETAVQNNSRKGCPGPIACSVHHHVVVDLCPHQPRCIRPEREDVYCCLSQLQQAPEHAWPPMTSDMESSGMSIGRESAEQLMQRSSTDYSGVEFLEEAVDAGEI